MARTPMLDRDPDKFVPRFREEHVSTGGRVYGIKKVPQSSMFEITGEGAGDLPEALKGRFTSTGRAERSLKAYLNSQRQLLAAAKAKQAEAEAAKAEAALKEDNEAVVDVFVEVEKDPKPVVAPPVAVVSVEKTEDKQPATPAAVKGKTKLPVTAKTEVPADKADVKS